MGTTGSALRLGVAIALVAASTAGLGYAQTTSSGKPAASPPAAPAAPTSRKSAATQWTADGLESVKIRGLDVAYMRPGSSLAGYHQYRLPPISVAFTKNWERSSSTHGRISATDAQKIKDRLSTLANQELEKALGAGGYRLTDQAGDDVLDLDIRIVNLDVTAPDVLTAGRQAVFAVSAGHMTLVAELRDSVSGETIMRIYDTEEGDSSTRMRKITSMENERQAREVVGSWARALNQLLDAAKGNKKG